MLSSPASIASTSAGSTHLSAGEHLALGSGVQLSHSAGHSWLASVREGLSLFAYKLGIRLVAAAGKLEVVAQQDRIVASSLKDLEIISTHDEIRISAKQSIQLNAAGSYTTISASGIESGAARVTEESRPHISRVVHSWQI